MFFLYLRIILHCLGGIRIILENKMHIENKTRDRPTELAYNREEKSIFILCKQSQVMCFLRDEEHDTHNHLITDVFESYII